MNTQIRRLVFRPWLMEFLSRCFKNFVVAFWDSKGETYIDEIAPAILARPKSDISATPCFVWSGQESEAVEFDDGASIAWD